MSSSPGCSSPSVEMDRLPFLEGERVLCFHGPLIYEAKINKVKEVRVEDGAALIKYLIHYHGWNKNWDEWVPEARMLKYTESNLARKSDLQRAHAATQRAKKAAAATKRKLQEAASGAHSPLPPKEPADKRPREDKKEPSTSEAAGPVAPESGAPASAASSPKPPPEKTSRSSSRKSATPTSTTAKKNAKRIQVSAKEQQLDPSSSGGALVSDHPPDTTVETEEQFYTKVEVRIHIPDELKPHLVDDWDYLTRQRKLVMLPARITVDQLMQDYVKHKNSSKNSSKNKESAVAEVTAGLLEYFNVMLGSQLLYKFEREQFSDALKEHPGKPASQLYGPIHLLRLFVKLGGMLVYTPLDEKSVQLLMHYVNDFLAYMKRNAADLFKIQDYGTASPEYHRRAL